MKISVAKLISKKIQSWGIKDVFVFQGGAIMNVLSEIGKNTNLKYYCPYHEQSLAMAVDAYSRLGKLSAGFVTSGPGATNLITGVACSYYDSIPAIFFSGQVGQFHITGHRKVRQRGFQESDIVSLFKPITKLSCQIKDAKEAEKILDNAYRIAVSGRPGPVLIDVPFNIQKSTIFIKNKYNFVTENKINDNKKISADKIKIFINHLKKSTKPLLICGGGVRLSNTINNFLNFVKLNKLPFVTTWPAQDIAAHDFPYNFGSIGRHAHNSANILAAEADLIITFGVRFSPKILGKNFAKNAQKVISIDIDRHELNDGLFEPNYKFNYDLNIFFKKIKKKITHVNLNWISFCKKIKKENYSNFAENEFSKKLVNPYKFMDKLSRFTKKNSILLTDAGCNLTYFMQAYKNKTGDRMISAWGNSPMGYSIAAGIGAKLAKPKNQVISLIGDGSFLINLQDLQFIQFNNVNLKIIVIDNQVFGNTKIGCESYKIKNVGNDSATGYYPPNVKSICRAFKFNYIKITNDASIEKKIKLFLIQNKRSVLHVQIHKNSPLIEHEI